MVRPRAFRTGDLLFECYGIILKRLTARLRGVAADRTTIATYRCRYRMSGTDVDGNMGCGITKAAG